MGGSASPLTEKVLNRKIEVSTRTGRQTKTGGSQQIKVKIKVGIASVFARWATARQAGEYREKTNGLRTSNPANRD